MDYAKRGLEHSGICRFFVEIATVYFALSTIISIITAIYMCFQPESSIILEDTGYSYRFDMLIGYAQLSCDNLPPGAVMAGAKVFCVSYILLSVVAKNLPVLLVLYHIIRILNTIKKSHSPFVPVIVENVKRVGYIMIVMGLCSKIVLQMGMGLVAFHMPYMNNPVVFSCLFAGVIVFLVGDIMEWGCELQEFSDETL